MRGKVYLWLIACLVIVLFTMSSALAAVNDAYAGYEFDDNHLSGAKPLDVSGNGRDGTFSSADTGATGILGQAFDFEEANNDNVSLTDQDGLSTGFGINVWVKPESDHEGVIVTKRDGNQNDNYLNYRIKLLVGGAIQFYAGNTVAAEHCFVNGVGNVGVGVWSMISFNYSSGACQLFVNGTLAGQDSTTTGTIYTHNGLAQLGTNGNTTRAGFYFDGLIDEYYFYQHSLSQADLDELWNSGTGFQPYASTGNATVTATDYYDGSSLTNFTVTWNGSNYTTTNGTVVLNVSNQNDSVWNLTVYSTESGGYFSRSHFGVNFSVTDPYTVTPHQAEITFNASNRVTGSPVTTFSVNTSSNGGSASESAVSPQLNVTAANDYQFTFSKNGWYDTTIDGINLSALSQTNQEFEVFDYVLNVSLTVLNGSVTDQNFTIDVYGSGSVAGYYERVNTTNGIATLNITPGNYTIYVNDSIHADTNKSIELNASDNFTALTIDVYSRNSILFNIRDADGGALITDRNVSVFITGGIESYTFTTDNGSEFVDLIVPDDYTATYSATGYYQGEYFFTLTDGSTQEIDLYMVNESESEIVATVVDELTSTVESVIIRLQRKNLSGTNYYETDACTTNPSGQCILHANVGEVTYRATLEYEGSVARITNDFKFTSTSQTFRITIGENPLETINQIQGVSYTLSVVNTSTNATFTLTWADSNNNVQTGCIDVTSRRYLEVSNETTCNQGASGSFNVTKAFGTSQEVCGDASFVSNGNNIYVDSVCVQVTSRGAQNFGDQGLFLFGLLLIGSLILSLSISSAAAIAIPVVTAFMVAVGFWLELISITSAGVGAIVVLATIIAVVVKK